MSTFNASPCQARPRVTRMPREAIFALPTYTPGAPAWRSASMP